MSEIQRWRIEGTQYSIIRESHRRPGAFVYYSDHVADKAAAVEKLEEERDWLRKRDGHATMKLCYNDGSNPFAREDLTVVDVGVSDNCYVVESKVLKALQAENKTLRTALEELQAKAKRMYGSSLSKSDAAGWTSVSRFCEQALEDKPEPQEWREVTCPECQDACRVDALIRRNPLTGKMTATLGCPEREEIGRVHFDLEE